MNLEDDGLLTPDVGEWSEQKYKLVEYYAKMFATGMKNQWKCRIYIDLFAGAGRSRLRESGRLVDSSAILALRIPDKFDKYVFCDKDERKLTALRTRVEREFSGVQVDYVLGDVNASTDKIVTAIPMHHQGFNVLSFCFADPYNLGNLCFPTIRKLSERYMDFLILIATDMDANRNEDVYTQPDNNAIAFFLDHNDWRIGWHEARSQGIPFGLFIFNAFSRQMQTLEYKPFEAEDSVLVRNFQKKAPLYRLALYSRNPLGASFFKQAKKYSNPQTNLFDGV